MSAVKEKRATHDFRFENHGSVIMVRCLNKDAEKWVSDNVVVEDWQWIGNGFSCDPRYLENLYHGIEENGFSVDWGY